MDGIITTILAGVIVALIGAYAAYYFGGLRERQKQEEETEKEINERRAEAITEIRSRALSVGEVLKSWANESARMPEKMPRIGTERDWLQFSKECLALLHQRDSVLNSMTSLRDFYRRESPYLEAKQHRLYESFDKEFNRRYTTLSNYIDKVLLTDAGYRTTAEAQQGVAEYERTLQSIEARRRSTYRILGPIGYLTVPFARRKRRREATELYEEVKGQIAGLPKAARLAQEWDLHAQLRAFDAEAEQLARLASR